MGKAGCLVFFVVIGLLAVELWFVLSLAEWVSPGNPEYLGAVLGTVVLSAIGIHLLRQRSRRLPMAMMAGTPGPAFVGLLGAGLIALPGYLSGVIGLVLQLPPLQRAFGRVASVLLMRNLQRMAQRMGTGQVPPGAFPGGMPPGGFPDGTPPFRFPGGTPVPGDFARKPDSRARGGKVIETTAERVDEDDDAR